MMPAGRPTTYKSEYCERIVEFFDRNPYEIKELENEKTGDVKQVYVPSDFPTFEKFAADIGVTIQTLLNWTREHNEFFEAYKKAKQLQHNILVQCGLIGAYSSGFAVFTAKNILEHPEGERWTDKQQTDHISSNGSMTPERTIDPTKLSDSALEELNGAFSDDGQEK